MIIPETVREEEEDENLNQVDGKSSKSITHLDDHPTLNDSKTDTQQDTGNFMLFDMNIISFKKRKLNDD